MKTRFLRCTESGCRRLTSNGLCDEHREPEQAANPQLSPEGAARLAEQLALFAQARQDAGHRAQMRDDLAALADGAAKQMRRTEVPVFADEQP